jgi:esterase/lipase superfamily enzyme
MLMMVTCRRKKAGRYTDEERSGHRSEYLFDYDNGKRRKDGFRKSGERAFKRALLAELIRLKDSGIGTPKVGIYLHGYNNDWHDSIDEAFDWHKLVTKELGYSPIVVGFSWPSTGKWTHYLSDREEVRDSVPAFTRFLLDINKFLSVNEKKCFSTAYCVAHSMGNYLLRKGMEYLSDQLGSPYGRMMFSETVMLNPDLASKAIEIGGKADYVRRFSRRVHIYYSKYDRAIKASSVKRFGSKRLGRHGASDYSRVPENVILVNSEIHSNSEVMQGIKDRAGKQVSVHASARYHPAIVSDVVSVLSSVDRGLIQNREPVPSDAGCVRNHYLLVQ